MGRTWDVKYDSAGMVVTAGADGTLRCGSAVGSIHKVGALVQEAPSCNGWAFWHLLGPGGKLTLIDDFRQQVAAG
jgi:modification methylase